MNTLKRTRFLKGARIINTILISLTVMVGIFYIMSLIAALFDPGVVSYTIDYPNYVGEKKELVVEGNRIAQAILIPKGSIFIKFKSSLLELWASLSGIGVVAFLLFIFFSMSGFFNSLKTKHPFIVENAIRLKRIGYATVGIVGFIALNKWVLNYYILSSIKSTLPKIHYLGSVDNLYYYLSFLMLGCVVLVIGEVFRLGIEIREDQELTI